MLGKVSILWLYVSDLDRSVRFYGDTLGLPLRGRWHEGAMFDAGNLELGLHLEEGDVKRGNSPIITFAINRGIEEVHQALKDRAIEFNGPITEHPYGKVVSFQDPDGHVLLLHEPPPESDA